MPRNGSGGYSLPSVTPPIQAGASIAAASMNTTLSDLATAMTGSVAADGQTPITGNWNFNSKNISGVNTLGAIAAAFSSTVAASGAATFGSTLATTGAATFGSTVAITGTATAANGTSGTQVVNYSQFVLGSGSFTLPGGLYVKWGYSTTTAGVGNVTYAVPFPTLTLCVQMTIGAASAPVVVSPLLTATVNAAGFDVRGNPAENLEFWWFALGS